MNKRWRQLRMGLETVTGWKKQGFFIPYRYAGTVPTVQPRYDAVEAVFDAARPAFETVLDAAARHADALAAIGGPAPSPRWEQEWFPRLDGAAAWLLTREAPPARIVEVGSGHSTRFLAHALKAAGAEARQVCIDPAPRAALLDLAVEWRSKVLGPEDMDLFEALEPGDMAVFDSSHILMPGTDVDIILSRVLPVLKPGVRVHVHDVFLPDPYPGAWLWRGYNEQNALAPWILSGGLKPLWASHYAATRMGAGDRPGIAQLPFRDVPESSAWFEKA